MSVCYLFLPVKVWFDLPDIEVKKRWWHFVFTSSGVNSAHAPEIQLQYRVGWFVLLICLASAVARKGFGVMTLFVPT